MARTWLQIRVDLLGGAGMELDRAPGRVFLVGPGHTFEQLADAINEAFARWEPAHLHEFELRDGRRIGFPDAAAGLDSGGEDHAKVKVATAVGPGDEFAFTFDFGDEWRHRCRVLAEKVDPADEFWGTPPPRRPVATLGWGWIPDQHGNESADELELD
jgi:hypothetical protein